MLTKTPRATVTRVQNKVVSAAEFAARRRKRQASKRPVPPLKQYVQRLTPGLVFPGIALERVLNVFETGKRAPAGYIAGLMDAIAAAGVVAGTPRCPMTVTRKQFAQIEAAIPALERAFEWTMDDQMKDAVIVLDGQGRKF